MSDDNSIENVAEQVEFSVQGVSFVGSQHVGELKASSHVQVPVRLGQYVSVRGQRSAKYGQQGWSIGPPKWPYVGPDGYALGFDDGLHAGTGPEAWDTSGVISACGPYGMLIGAFSRYRAPSVMSPEVAARIFGLNAFPIGSDWYSTRCPINGYLYLLMNDGLGFPSRSDNQGSIEVQVFLSDT